MQLTGEDVFMINPPGKSGKPALEGGVPVRADFLPFHRPIIGEEEIREVADTLRSGWITTGPRTKRFEKAFSQAVGMDWALGLNSCTAGIHLALIVSGIGPGDEVLLPAVSFPSTANAVVQLGATPVFVDVERDTLNLDAARIRDHLTEKTKAMIVVHFAGNPCEMDEIIKVANENKLVVIEDCAHALEACYKGKRVGTFGDYASFSFYATKNMTTGEGGMLVTRRGDKKERLQILSLHGISHDAWKRFTPDGYQHWETVYPGFKYNMYDIQAAIGVHQLKRVDEWLWIRKAWTERYDSSFADFELLTPLRRRDCAKAAFHLYVILLEQDRLVVDRDRILNALQAENIGVGVHFRSLHLHPFYRDYFTHGDLSISEESSSRILSLPLYPGMKEQDVEDVITAVKKVLNYYQK